MINIFLVLWKACCSVGGIFLIDKIGARKPLSKCNAKLASHSGPH